MQKKLLSGLFWILLLNLLIKPFWILGIETGVQNAVGVNEYGFYFTIFNLAYIFNILLDLGVTNFNTRNIARHPVLIDKHLPGILAMKLMLALLYAAVTFTVGLLSGYSSRQFSLLAILTFNQFLNSLILYLRSNFEGLMLFKWDSVISILDRVVMIAICALMLWGPAHHITVEWFALAQTAAYAVTATTALAVLTLRIRREHNAHFSFRSLRVKKAFAIVILRKSFPFALLVLLMASYNRIDPLLLSWLHPDGTFQAGIYAGAFRLLDALTMVAYLVSVPLLPVFARMTAEHDAQLGDTTRMVTGLMVVFSVAAAALFSSHSGQFMQLLYPRQPDHAGCQHNGQPGAHTPLGCGGLGMGGGDCPDLHGRDPDIRRPAAAEPPPRQRLSAAATAFCRRRQRGDVAAAPHGLVGGTGSRGRHRTGPGTAAAPYRYKEHIANNLKRIKRLP